MSESPGHAWSPPEQGADAGLLESDSEEESGDELDGGKGNSTQPHPAESFVSGTATGVSLLSVTLQTPLSSNVHNIPLNINSFMIIHTNIKLCQA